MCRSVESNTIRFKLNFKLIWLNLSVCITHITELVWRSVEIIFLFSLLIFYFIETYICASNCDLQYTNAVLDSTLLYSSLLIEPVVLNNKYSETLVMKEGIRKRSQRIADLRLLCVDLSNLATISISMRDYNKFYVWFKFIAGIGGNKTNLWFATQ